MISIVFCTGLNGNELFSSQDQEFLAPRTTIEYCEFKPLNSQKNSEDYKKCIQSLEEELKARQEKTNNILSQLIFSYKKVEELENELKKEIEKYILNNKK